MQSITYIGPKPTKDLKGYSFPFGKARQVPDDIAREALKHPHLFTDDPSAVPDQRPSRRALLQAEIRDAEAYREQYRDDLTFAKREKDADKKRLIIAACQREMGWADSKIERCRLELRELDAEEAEPPKDEKPKAEKPPKDEKPKAEKPKIDTGTPETVTA